MSLLLTIRRGADKQALIAALEGGQVRWCPIAGLESVIRVQVDSVDDFPLRDHPAIVSVVPGDTGTSVSADSRSIDYTTGPWHILRHTSRDLPYSLREPIRRPTRVHSRERTGAGVDVYLVDASVRSTHVEFAGRTITAIYDYAGGTAGADATVHTHGTNTMSLIAGATLGFATSAHLFIARCLPDVGSGDIAGALAALGACRAQHMQRNNPGVINCSFGAAYDPLTADPFAAAVGDCMSSGLVVCASAGNDRISIDTAASVLIPGATLGAITVGGIARDDTRYNVGPGSGTNHGLQVDVLAAGQAVVAAIGDNDIAYGATSGTSLSVAIVAGIVACMLEGYEKPMTYAQAQAVGIYLHRQATFGRYIRDPAFEPMTGAIAYLDPLGVDAVPPIPGLVRKAA